MAWVTGLQDKEGVLQGWWLDVKTVFTTCPWGMWLNRSRTGFKEASGECARVCAWTSGLEGASKSNPFTWPPPHVFHPPYSFRHMGAWTHTYTQIHRHFSLCPSLCLLMPRPLASPLCRMWQVGDVTAVLMPDQVWPKSQHTQTHSSTTLHRGSTAGLAQRR